MSNPTRGQILSLYRNYLATAQTFSSYNFRTYFLRRSRDLFRSALLPPQQAALSSPFSKAGSQTVPASPSTLTSPAPSILSESKSSLTAPPPSGKTNPASEGAGSADAEKLQTFYQTALKDLEVLRRAALTNRMYTGEKLVIEKPRLIVGGGGSGAEADAAPNEGGAPPSN